MSTKDEHQRGKREKKYQTRTEKKRNRKKKLSLNREKQNLWVLDCLNSQKSKLKPYSPLKDKYLRYFLIGMPRKNKASTVRKRTERNYVEGNDFKNFLNSKKQQIMKEPKLPEIHQKPSVKVSK